jgi:Flp pilus assembly protein TadG
MIRKISWVREGRRFLAKVSGHSQLDHSRAGLFREEGSALVEIAIASSVLFALVLGVAQTSLLFYAYHFVSDAAREGTRFAMVRGGNCTANVGVTFCSPTDNNAAGADNGDIQAYVRTLGYPYANGLTTSTTWYAVGGAPTTFTSCGNSPSGCNAASSSMVQVRVSYAFPIAIPFWRKTSITISSTSAQLVQQ